jgi:hypothetical protein
VWKGTILIAATEFPYRKKIASSKEVAPFLVTFSGEAEKVTARRAGALLREATKLRPNFKHSTLRRRTLLTPE